jgi:nucleotide-binding universal stress UspA family protein
MTDGILCTIDFSDSSREALKWSIELAAKLNCHLSVLYTYRLFNKQNGEVSLLKRRIEEDALKNFGVLEKELLKEKGIDYDFKTEVGFVDDRIEDHTKKNKISFLVIGKGIVLRNKETFDELLNQLQAPLVIIP